MTSTDAGDSPWCPHLLYQQQLNSAKTNYLHVLQTICLRFREGRLWNQIWPAGASKTYRPCRCYIVCNLVHPTVSNCDRQHSNTRILDKRTRAKGCLYSSPILTLVYYYLLIYSLLLLEGQFAQHYLESLWARYFSFLFIKCLWIFEVVYIRNIS